MKNFTSLGTPDCEEFHKPHAYSTPVLQGGTYRLVHHSGNGTSTALSLAGTKTKIALSQNSDKATLIYRYVVWVTARYQNLECHRLCLKPWFQALWYTVGTLTNGTYPHLRS